VARVAAVAEVPVAPGKAVAGSVASAEALAVVTNSLAQAHSQGIRCRRSCGRSKSRNTRHSSLVGGGGKVDGAAAAREALVVAASSRAGSVHTGYGQRARQHSGSR